MAAARDVIQPSYRADIDGLRAIAITSVVLFHAGIFPFASGFVGVDVFFVISGYLIGGIILRDISARRFSFALFYARRARRILPALITVVLATCVAGWLLLSPFQFTAVGATGVSALLGVSNISYFRFQNYFASDSRLYPMLMTWSLGVEEQFYLLFPFLLFGIERWAPRKAFLALCLIAFASFLASVWATYAYPSAAFYLLPCRAWELGAGVILALIELTRSTSPGRTPLLESGLRQQVAGFGGLALLVVSIFAFDETVPFPGFVAVLPVVGTAALISARSSWVNRNLLSSRPMVFVGAISYSWYLWHWPLMSYVRNVAFDEPPASVMLLTAGIAFGLALLSWRFIEQPFRHGPIRIRPVLLGYATALTVVVAVPMAIKLGHGFPAHATPEARRVDSVRITGMGGGCLVDWEDDKPLLIPRCLAERDGHPTVVLIGDSHASALSDEVRALAAKQDWGYEIFTKPMCRPLLEVTNWHHSHPRQAETCASYMQAAFARTVSDPTVDTVILAGFWPLEDSHAFSEIERYAPIAHNAPAINNVDLFQYGLKRAVQTLTAAGKHVIVLGDVPTWRLDVSQVSLTRSNAVRARLAPWLWSRYPSDFPDRPGVDFVYAPNEADTELFRSLAQQPMVTYVDLFKRFCSDTTCVFEANGNPYFIDDAHLSLFGAHYALKDVPLRGLPNVVLSSSVPSPIASSLACRKDMMSRQNGVVPAECGP